MNEETKSNYYAIIPATVRYDNNLKPAEKLLYGEITALSNKLGYCYANNRYFAELYNVTIGTVSKWISHLQKLEYIIIVIERNEKNEVISRKIYINDLPYGEKRQYPYSEKEIYPMDKNDKYNIINNKKIDDLFIAILNRDRKISDEFYGLMEKLGLLYDLKTVKILKDDKEKMIKEITYTIYDLFNSNFVGVLQKFDRKTIMNIYLICKDAEARKMNTEDSIQDFIMYYRKSLINLYSNNF